MLEKQISDFPRVRLSNMYHSSSHGGCGFLCPYSVSFRFPLGFTWYVLRAWASNTYPSLTECRGISHRQIKIKHDKKKIKISQVTLLAHATKAGLFLILFKSHVSSIPCFYIYTYFYISPFFALMLCYPTNVAVVHRFYFIFGPPTVFPFSMPDVGK